MIQEASEVKQIKATVKQVENFKLKIKELNISAQNIGLTISVNVHNVPLEYFEQSNSEKQKVWNLDDEKYITEDMHEKRKMDGRKIADLFSEYFKIKK